MKIIDTGTSNIASVRNAFKKLGIRSSLTVDRHEILNANALVFPGVGAFGSVAKRIQHLSPEIKARIKEKRPTLCICLGMQLLFEFSEESPGVTGVGALEGRITKLHKKTHFGWGKVYSEDKIIGDGYAYFAHTYGLRESSLNLLGVTEYNGLFISAFRIDCVLATQFHPEISGEYGLELLKRWRKIW